MEKMTKNVVIAGGTGNVGSFLVTGFLQRGATVVVPSRSADKLDALKEHLSTEVDVHQMQRLYTFEGNVADEEEGSALLSKIEEQTGPVDAVFASLGRMSSFPSLLTASKSQLQAVIDDYLMAHFLTARTFLPGLRDRGGTYVLINGPLAFRPGDGVAGVSIATAGQQMLFRCLAMELEESPARLLELVSYAFIRDKQTQPGSDVTGRDVAAMCTGLISGQIEAENGDSFHLKQGDSLPPEPTSRRRISLRPQDR